MRIVPFLAFAVVSLSTSCGNPPGTELFAPTATSATATGTGGDSTTGSATSGVGGGSAGTEPGGSSGASAAVGAGGIGATTTGTGGSDPGTGGSTGGEGGGNGGGVDAGAGGAGPNDGGPADADAASGSVRRIRCGDITCVALEQFCCLRDGRAPLCEPVVGGDCPTSGDRLYCDDRNDCAIANQICCAADLPSTNSLADCRLPGTCNGTKAQRLCDPQDEASCRGLGMNSSCGADGQSTIDGYAYCH